jgi:hypothetical protein|nr:MAG: hypothetical protein [Bacteriophage sp.]UWF98289.1 MAG: hypothetical protein [Bacteriophage sp.]UWG91753.1 MAG: hypothetical protein [Bacteriophage sp.]
MLCKKKKLENKKKEGLIMIRNYISVKFVKAEPCKAWKKYGEHDVGADGYKIYYQSKDKYISWCPKEEFEKQYLQLEEDNKITQKDVDNFITKTEAIKMSDKTTVVQATCKNGFTITDGSACVDAKNFDMEIGKQCCMEHIKDKIWGYLGFLLQCAKSGFKGNK